MLESRFNAIVILDAIPHGQLNTARSLKSNLRDITDYIAEGLKVRYVRIETYNDLELGFAKILDEINNNGLKPWIHLEGHGLSNETGFEFAGGTSCSWVQLKKILIPINIALSLNLFLILATCFGGSFASAIETTDRAPVLALIGPPRKVKAREVERVFPVFYKTFFESQSLSKALVALDNGVAVGPYYKTSAEKFFYTAWAGYKKNYCTEDQIDKRVWKVWIENVIIKKKRSPLVSIDQQKRLLRNPELESKVFEKCRDRYFMYDIDETNRERFPVTYNKAESYTDAEWQ
jgi:hypothetical protein